MSKSDDWDNKEKEWDKKDRYNSDIDPKRLYELIELLSAKINTLQVRNSFLEEKLSEWCAKFLVLEHEFEILKQNFK